MPNFATHLAMKLARIAVPVLALGALYLLALHKHAERDAIRQAAVALTPGCVEKLKTYALAPSREYESPYVLKRTGASITLQGYSEEDVRAIQRGCNIVDDTQGQLAANSDRERWNVKRFIRGSHTSCDHCHQGIGDKQDAAGNRLKGVLPCVEHVSSRSSPPLSSRQPPSPSRRRRRRATRSSSSRPSWPWSPKPRPSATSW